MEYIFEHVVKIIHAPIRQYDKHGTLEKIYGEMEVEKNNDPIQCHDELYKNILSLESEACPVIYAEDYPVYYAIVSSTKKRYLIGPICSEITTARSDGDNKGEYIPKIHKTKDKKIRISYCTIKVFGEEILLLHNFLHDTKVTYAQLLEKNYLTDTLEHNVQQELGRVYFDYQENEKVHNPYDLEIREMESIRKGDMEGLRKSLDEVFYGEYGTLSKNRLQAAKNLGICGIVLASRAAIEGGLHPEKSFSICDSYILMLDEAKNSGEVEVIVRSAKFKYAEMICQMNQKVKSNAIVEKCKNIIFKNMHNKIEVKDLAKQMNFSPEYLSRVFWENEGIHLKEFINREKINLTENLLVYSNYAYEEIAYYFGFCSQSHFGKVFKQWKGITPKQYRERFGVSEFIYNFDKAKE